ncbi:MAG: Trk system potassium transporter TrkA [Rhizobiales bacterium]|nr:Trk system potassium transporter TrkA [Hyphomicrobiales bacterium]
MKVLICGAGQVGFGIAERLAQERNDVTVIDTSPHLIDVISDALDVRGLVGHGSHPDLLDRAGAGDADMIIAVTLYDEVNMMACQIAHSLFDIPTKIARVRAQSYLAPMWKNLFSRDHMPIDVIISPEVEVGESVLRRLSYPGAFETVTFADGAISFVGVSLTEDCPVVDTPLSQLSELFPDLKAVVVGIGRDAELFIPRSADQLLVGDEVFFIADSEHVERALGIFGHSETEAQRIIIAGAGNIGRYVARNLEERNARAHVKMIEADRDIAAHAADELTRTVVLHGSALDQTVLAEAGTAEAEMFVALTNDDKVNMLASVMAKGAGCNQVLSLLIDTSYARLQRPLGVDAFINPRTTTVSTILRHVRRGRIRGVHSLKDGAAEVMEAEALETSPLIGKPLRDADLPAGTRIGAVLRADEVLIPSGDMRIAPHDRIVVFANADAVHAVEQMFRVSLEFF